MKHIFLKHGLNLAYRKMLTISNGLVNYKIKVWWKNVKYDNLWIAVFSLYFVILCMFLVLLNTNQIENVLFAVRAKMKLLYHCNFLL